MDYATVESPLDDVSIQMTSSNLWRHSRPSNGQRTGPVGGNVRIAKPNSASNSPRGSMGLGRRRTVMGDSPYRRRLARLEQSGGAFAGLISNNGPESPSRSNRPMSWHPASHPAPKQSSQPTYHQPAFDPSIQIQQMNFSPTPSAHPVYASPGSTFSPLSIPYSGYEQEQQQYHFQNTSVSCQPNTIYTLSQSALMQQHPQTYSMAAPQTSDHTMCSHFDWNSLATHGYSTSTSPPTPEDFLPIQHPEPALPSEESITYHPLSDTEEAGEQLIGLGLYDTPDAAKSPSPDPHLDHYRSLMMSGLHGPAYRRPEPAGKGLKLEETWNPPESDDEKDDDGSDDDELDGEAENDDEFTSEEITGNTVSYPVQRPQLIHQHGWV